MAVYFAFMQPGDTYMALDLAHGGHLTHGSPVNFSGRLYNAVHYGVDRETETINCDEVRGIALECRPKILVTGASVYPRIIDFAAMRSIADEVGALFMVDMAHIAGMVATGDHPSPVPHAQIVTSTTHKTLRGPRSGIILCKKEYAQAIDKSVFPGMQGGPLMHVIAARAVCFKEAMTPEFASYQKQIVANAKALAESFVTRGFRLVSGGTDTHLMLIDLMSKGMTGKQAQEILDGVGIVVNKNMIPFDQQKPFVTSGIRIGTPAVTTRGMGIPEMELIAELTAMALSEPESETVKETVRSAVKELCDEFPIYGGSN
jgi:glycine hydroxymethyltransferase